MSLPLVWCAVPGKDSHNNTIRTLERSLLAADTDGYADTESGTSHECAVRVPKGLQRLEHYVLTHNLADVRWQSQTIALFSVKITERLTFANHDKFRLTATLDTRRKTRAYLGILNCDRTHLHLTVGAIFNLPQV